jgi:hypothetical protein
MAPIPHFGTKKCKDLTVAAYLYMCYYYIFGVWANAVGWGTVHTSRNDADSIPSRVSEIFYGFKPPGCTAPGVNSASNRNKYQGFSLGG